jgi:hypothetical protein
MKSLRIFVSSTSDDLIDYRREVRDTILRLNHYPIIMENFNSSDKNAMQLCYDKVLEADIFIGIYAHRYGFIPEAEFHYHKHDGQEGYGDGTTSITHWEYKWAFERRIPILLFFIKDDYIWPLTSFDSESNTAKLKEFRNHVSRLHTLSFFTTPSDLVSRIATSLIDALSTNITNSPIKIEFDKKPSYPRLAFSILNLSYSNTQIVNIRLLKASSVKDKHEMFDSIFGPRMNIDVDLEQLHQGSWAQIFGSHYVSNLRYGESEAFSINISNSKNTLNLLDVEIEYISNNSDGIQVYRPESIIIVHSPVSDRLFENHDPVDLSSDDPQNGTISVIDRKKAFDALINNSHLNLWNEKEYADCRSLPDVLLRGSSRLCLNFLEVGWDLLRSKWENKTDFGAILASFTESALDISMPVSIATYFDKWIRDPYSILKIMPYDIEDIPTTIVKSLGRLHNNSEIFYLDILDATICTHMFSRDKFDPYDMIKISSLVNVREYAMASLARKFGSKCIEYLVSIANVQDFFSWRVTKIINILTNVTLESYDIQEIAVFWNDWWNRLSDTQKREYSQFKWRENSPRLLQFIEATSDELPFERLDILSNSSEPHLRALVALNSATTASTLDRLSNDPDLEVAMNVASNPNTSTEVLYRLAQSDSKGVRNTATRMISNRTNPEDMNR